MKYTVKCTNCGERLEIPESELIDKDIYYADCPNCDYPVEIEIEYDEEDNIVELYAY